MIYVIHEISQNIIVFEKSQNSNQILMKLRISDKSKNECDDHPNLGTITCTVNIKYRVSFS
jgi:hypothetical protein